VLRQREWGFHEDAEMLVRARDADLATKNVGAERRVEEESYQPPPMNSDSKGPRRKSC